MAPLPGGGWPGARSIGHADVQTRQSGEWLMLRYADGSSGELRLDQLQHFEERPPAGVPDNI
ncbi:hypothetical protein [Sulfuriferula multivorans]|uniref:hypothetical protein n=1 Tax=Sulfuriferula multivorans TaxID=1559896 RepID=UPI000F5BF869|nr:hypothetical protein [Sulfuriferula multivorans]